jgi:hypothetical protein
MYTTLLFCNYSGWGCQHFITGQLHFPLSVIPVTAKAVSGATSIGQPVNSIPMGNRPLGHINNYKLSYLCILFIPSTGNNVNLGQKLT